jgi:hypothetical protein
MPKIRKHFAYRKIGENPCEILLFLILKKNLSSADPQHKYSHGGADNQNGDAFPTFQRKRNS